MDTYVRLDENNNILSSSNWPTPGMVKVDYEVVRGYDGKLYKAGEEPVKSEEQIQEERFASLRYKRDEKLRETDYFMTVDKYNMLTEENKVDMGNYRQKLRDITEQVGAPWDGGGEETPWPVKPDLK